MASVTYHVFKRDLMTNAVNLTADTVKVALHTSAYTINQTSHTVWNATVSASEVVGVGYTTGGATLGSKTVTSAGSEARWDGADVTWSSSTITARYAILYSTTNSNALICVIDFGSDKSSSNGDFTIQWNTEGIVNINDA